MSLRSGSKAYLGSEFRLNVGTLDGFRVFVEFGDLGCIERIWWFSEALDVLNSGTLDALREFGCFQRLWMC